MLDINTLNFKEDGNDVWFLIWDGSCGKYSYQISPIETAEKLKYYIKIYTKFVITKGAFYAHVDSEQNSLPKFRQHVKEHWPEDYVVVFVKKQDGMFAYIGKPNDDFLQRFSLDGFIQ